MTLAQKTLVGVLALLALVFSVGLLQTQQADASSPAGLPASVASSTALTMAATTASMVVATSSCNARIISTQASPIMLTFSDYANQTPTAGFGHLQAASTTVVYDSGQYGCGLVKAYSFTAQTITVTDVR